MFLATVRNECFGISIDEAIHKERLKKEEDMCEMKKIVKDLGFSHKTIRAVRKSWIYSFDLQKVQNARDLLNTKEIKRDIFPHLAFGKGCMHKKVTLTPTPNPNPNPNP